MNVLQTGEYLDPKTLIPVWSFVALLFSCYLKNLEHVRALELTFLVLSKLAVYERHLGEGRAKSPGGLRLCSVVGV